MNKQRIATIIAFAAILSLALLPVFRATASAQNQKAFVGLWERIAIKGNDGQPVTGAVVPSQLNFNADGHYLQVTNPPGREKLDKPIKEMTKEELLNRFEGVSGGYGTYALSGNTLTRKSLTNSDPNREGTENKQTYKFEGDLLILNGTTNKVETRFRRVK